MAPHPYSDVKLLIDGTWRTGAKSRQLDITNPATGDTLAHVSCAETADLDDALAAAEKGFAAWQVTSAFERYKLMRKAAEILRGRAADIATRMTLEQGKPLAESKGETLAAADIIDWFAEEGRRAYGRTIPARTLGVQQVEIREPVGPVAAFTPWNFPINQAVRKISAALAAGCSVILKGPEETPSSCAGLIEAFVEAGLPAGTINLVYGIPSEISGYLIPHPVIRKISFTGSTSVGKQLAMLAGKHMKRVTMELGGHAPAIVFADADVESAASILSFNKYRNAGQICVAPTRFLIQDDVHESFTGKFVAHAKAIKVGDGLSSDARMGPLANHRRLEAMETLVSDAVAKGAKLATGGRRIGNKGYFFEPTVLVDVPKDARIMNEEPFGPVAVINSFSTTDDVIAEANRLPYGLAAYAYTRSTATANQIARRVQSGMIGINHHGLGFPEVPFGGVKDSGYGSEGGADAIDAYLNTKYVSHMTA